MCVPAQMASFLVNSKKHEGRWLTKRETAKKKNHSEYA